MNYYIDYVGDPNCPLCYGEGAYPHQGDMVLCECATQKNKCDSQTDSSRSNTDSSSNKE